MIRSLESLLPTHRLTALSSLPNSARSVLFLLTNLPPTLCTLAVVMESFLRFYTQIYPSKNSNTYMICRSAVGVPLMSA